ncbi:MBL fold metallo-hydrolase [bacterium]|nr:MBL fold metallo-hydrolase [bacterium]
MHQLWASLQILGQVFCSTPPGLVTRTGEENRCWVSWKQAEQTFCVPRRIWMESLSSPGATFCWEGERRRFRNFSANDPSLLREFSQKPTISTWTATFWRPAPSGFLRKILQNVERRRENLSNLLRSHDSLGIFRKLLLGETGSGVDLGLFRILGFVHLENATGIHLYALAVWVDYLCMQIFSLFRGSVRFGNYLSRGLSASAWIGAWALAGGRMGMFRPLLIVFARKAAVSLGFRWRAYAPLAVALLSDVIWVGGVHQGRIHYALAVGGGLLAAEWVGKGKPFQTHFALAFGSWLPVAVLQIFHEHTLSPATPILSLLTVWIFSVGAYPLGFLSALTSHDFFGGLNFLQDIVGNWVRGLALLLFRWKAVLIISPLSFLMGLSFALALLALKSLQRRVLLLAVLILLSSLAFSDFRKEASVEQLDVGQGDAALIRWSGNAALFDTGRMRALKSSAWLKLLAQRGVTRLHFVALSHLDEDHAGGLQLLSDLLPIDCVLISAGAAESERGALLWSRFQSQKVRVRTLEQDVQEVHPCSPFPSVTLRDRKPHAGNSIMSGIWVPMGSKNYLSLGDASRFQERQAKDWIQQMRSRYPGPILFKVSHHGSKYSSDPEFLEWLRPGAAWISVGLGNSYGHPTREALGALERLGVPIRRTDLHGFIGDFQN